MSELTESFENLKPKKFWHKFNLKGKGIVPIVSMALALVALGAAGYFYKQYNDLKRDPQKAAQEETRELIQKVGRLIVLPTNEEPTIATVSDPEALRNQPFFTNAKSGDRVLIYTNAKKAILYNPDEDKIVEVAPVNIGDQDQQ